MSFSAVGQVWDLKGLSDHLKSLQGLSWAKGVCIHHTAYPHLSMRPRGWTIQHMRNIASYYKNDRRWSSGPHLFTDEDEVFGMTPMTERGIHAVSFNRTHIGIEALGDYDTIDDPNGKRGAQVWHTTVEAAAAILKRLNLPADNETIKFHRDDPRTSKTCPGKKIDKADFIERVKRAMESRTDEAEKEEEETSSMQESMQKIHSISSKALEDNER